MADKIPERGSMDDSCFMIWNNDLLSGGRRLSISINGGKELQRVTAYDVKKGWVEGYAIPLKHKDGVIERVRYEGEVAVTIVPRVPKEFQS